MGTYIDTREDEDTITLAQACGVQCQVKELPVGDIVCEEKSVCIERKTMADFMSSFLGGHMDKQLLQMEAAFEHPYVLVSGYESRSKVTDNAYVGYLAHVLVRFPKTKICFVPTDEQLFYLARKIIEKTNDGKTVSVEHTEAFRVKSPTAKGDVHAMMLACVPGIGIEKAKGILAQMSLNEMMLLTADDLTALDGVGPETARKIKEYLDMRIK